jgi:pyruvate-ferredoxin/flavodoxin oxidoreductase
MTEQEIAELPKAWGVGGDGGMGDIGFQNVSKVVLQNRPNVKLLMLDTQVYSNTGGQNSDSSPIPGGFDMNSMGAATQGKLTEMKSVAEAFLGGHGSPYVAQVSLANASKFYKSLLDALTYRGTAYLQCYTPCQPEHGIADDLSATQAKLSRDGRGLPEFVFDPQKGESYIDCLDISGNPAKDRDWWETKNRFTGKLYKLTTAHWAATEARFRRHFKQVKETTGLVHLDDFLWRITQDDVVHRRFLDPTQRCFIADFGVFIEVEDAEEKVKTLTLSRQMVLFCVERRKAWRLLQSKAGVVNPDYKAQQQVLARVRAGEISVEDFFKRASELVAAARATFMPAKPAPVSA